MNVTLSFRVACDNPREHIQAQATVAGNTQLISLQQESRLVEFALTDDAASQQLVIVLQGKTKRDTRIDDQGNILDDVLISVSDVMLDGVRIDQLFQQHARYWHRYNRDTGDMEAHAFYGSMGCNGELVFEFTTPAYLWLLENM